MRLLIAAFAILASAGSTAVGAVPPEEAEAVKQLRRFATNIQFHKDGSVRLVRLSKPIAGDAQMKLLANFKKLEYLAIVCRQVTDAGLVHIKELSELKTLLLNGTSMTDAGLKQLTRLKKLERLYLTGSAVTEAGLQHIGSLSNLRTLWLERTPVTDRALSHLKRLTHLEVLVLADTKVTDAGLKHIAAFRKLKLLDLSGCRIQGSGLSDLTPLTKLQYLQLTRTKVRDGALKAFPKLQSLRQIELFQTAVTASAVSRLRKALPRAGVAASPRTDGGSGFSQSGLTPERKVVTTKGPTLAPIHERLRSDPKMTPDFQRHVVPLLSRLGCNGRACHGSFQGRGGFRLSMFGYDFAMDHKNLAARIDRKSPRKSLILNKPTSKDEHEGGLRLPPGGWEQRLLRRWIAGGANGILKAPPKFVRLEMTPSEIVFGKTGESHQLRAVSVWSDGTREDVTSLTRFTTKDDAIATVSPGGQVTSKGTGDTNILAFYDNGIVATPVMRPVSDLVGDRYPNVPTPTPIDRLVVAKLKKLGIRPSKLCTDEEFLRRVSLDMVGTLPTPREIRAFVADKSSDKRSRKIDELLKRPAYVAWWTNRFCDLTGSNAGYLGRTEMAQPVAAQWRAWMERRVRDNVGWDKIVSGVVLARSRKPGQPYRAFSAGQSRFTSRKSAADYSAPGNSMPHFWFRDNITRPSDKALAFGYVFLGIKLDCAQCHKHPFDKWSKRDFELFTQFFTRIKAGVAPDAFEQHQQMRTMLGVPTILNTAALRRQSYLRIAAEGRPIPWKEIYIEPPRPNGKPHTARLLDGPSIDLNDFEDPRKPLMHWLRNEPNHYLARAFVNRIWAHYFNVGIVNPPDDLNLANPPSNKPLLDYLVKQFIKSGYDIKQLHRTIANSRTYQLGWRANETNRRDEHNFSRAVVRRLPAEVAVDAMIQSTGNTAVLARSTKTTAKRKIGQHPRSYQTRSIDYSLLIFGKSLRTTNCDCEARTEPTLLQALYVRNDQETIDRINRANGWLAEIRKRRPTAKTIDGLIEEAYLRVLSRFPDKQERADCRKHVLESKTIVDGMRDLLWALLNTQEFITNH